MATSSSVLYSTSLEAPTLFLRGDSDSDGEVALSDAVFTLTELFLSPQSPPCLDALDSNDDGRIDVADPVATLLYLFAGVPPPFPLLECAIDFTPDAIDCLSYPPCEPSPSILGCMDESALNFDASADIDDGSCYFLPDGLAPQEVNAQGFAKFVHEESGVTFVLLPGGAPSWGAVRTSPTFNPTRRRFTRPT